jgi:uncharacterized protein (TIGR00375 family)
MSEKILDFHIHSRYSRACSKDLDLSHIAKVCEQKGIDIVSTGDFTHPAWFKHIQENLVEENQGIYKLKDNSSAARFILGTEISCIYKDKDATRRVHLLILAPNIEAVAKFNNMLTGMGVNIRSDGRPIMGLSAKSILQILLDIDLGFLLIPAHAWTPWFAVFGSKSGYNRLADCFEELTPHIRAIETGLSSDPTMNHRLSALDNITLLSNSDAHSLDKLGREANVFDLSASYTYNEITEIIKTGNKKKFLYTIEFYPEEGKYHYDGHAVCKVSLSPAQTKEKRSICPVCKKNLTVGVLHRVEDLADREEEDISSSKFIPHKYIVPLKEIIAKVFGLGVGSKKVVSEYNLLINKIGSEFFILLHAGINLIQKNTTDKNVALAISNMREGNVKVIPGYDGIFGSVEVNLPVSKFKEKQSRLLDV